MTIKTAAATEEVVTTGFGSATPNTTLGASLSSGVNATNENAAAAADFNSSQNTHNTPSLFAVDVNLNADQNTMLHALAQQRDAVSQQNTAPVNLTAMLELLSNPEGRMLELLSTPEGRAQLQQMQVITSDGRVIPNPRLGVAHVYLRDISPRLPVNLPDLDGNLWSEFAQRLAPISLQIKKTIYCIMAFGVVVAILCAVTSFILHPFAVTGVVAGTALFSFCFVFFSGRYRWKAINEEVKEIVQEFGPKFQLKGHQLEHFDKMGMIVISRVENPV
jgi:hypothetical protein